MMAFLGAMIWSTILQMHRRAPRWMPDDAARWAEPGEVVVWTWRGYGTRRASDCARFPPPHTRPSASRFPLEGGPLTGRAIRS